MQSMSDVMSVRLKLLEEMGGVGGICTSSIADVLDAWDVGYVLSSRLLRLSGGRNLFFGKAYTVEWKHVRKSVNIRESGLSTWDQVRDFLVPGVEDGRGYVYVAGAGELVTKGALAGGLSITYFALQLRFEGVVLGGALRDQELVERIGLPVVATNFIPTDTQGNYRVSNVGGQCVIEHGIVKTNDWVFSDGNGTVVVPDESVIDIIREAAAIERKETGILERLHAGERLVGIVDEEGRI